MSEEPGSTSIFLDGEGRPQLVRSAVLFLDILGVSALATDSRSAGANLVELDRVLRLTFRDFLSEESQWPAALLSDSLVLVSPTLPGQADDVWVLNDLILQTAILQLQLVGSGFFVRGGLTIGEMHIHDGMVFGEALVRAYELERGRAIDPRVVLGQEAQQILEGNLKIWPGSNGSSDQGLLLADQDGEVFVDYLKIVLDEVDPMGELADHRDRVAEKLAEHVGERRRWEKYRWVADYHNQFCRRGQGLSNYEIPGLATTPRFDEFK